MGEKLGDKSTEDYYSQKFVSLAKIKYIFRAHVRAQAEIIQCLLMKILAESEGQIRVNHLYGISWRARFF